VLSISSVIVVEIRLVTFSFAGLRLERVVVGGAHEGSVGFVVPSIRAVLASIFSRSVKMRFAFMRLSSEALARVFYPRPMA
jgi:hypothetical protein